MRPQTIEEIKRHRGDLEFCVEKDVEFHDILVRENGNKVFELMLSPHAKLLRESRRETMKSSGAGRIIKGHNKILNAVIEKSPRRLKKLYMIISKWLRKILIGFPDLIKTRKQYLVPTY
jgi:DNA-binding FadR family transcriptional regulator